MEKVSKNEMPFLFIFIKDTELTFRVNFLILLFTGTIYRGIMLRGAKYCGKTGSFYRLPVFTEMVGAKVRRVSALLQAVCRRMETVSLYVEGNGTDEQ